MAKQRKHRKPQRKSRNRFVAQARARMKRYWPVARELWEERGTAWAGVVGALGVIAVVFALWPTRSVILASATTASTDPVPTHAQLLADPLSQEPWEFFHPMWKDEESWLSLSANPEERTGIKEQISEIRQIVSDPKGRIEPGFRVPEFLKDRVVFWMLVHSRYSRKIRVIHDRNDPAIIYGYLDFRPLYRVLGVTAVLEKRISAVEKNVLQGIRDRLKEAGGIGNSRLMAPKEREQIHSFLSHHGALGKNRIAALSSSIRTQTGQSDEFIAALHRSRVLLPHIESVFRQRNLPIALGRIPFVESSFNDIAYSKVGAMGIWQFMPATAQELIHRTKRELWSDPIWQTRGATRLFAMYRSVLPDWGTTVTSYNSGVGRVRRLIEKYRLTGIEGLLQLPEPDNLGFAGQNFYAQFLSANLVEAYKDELFVSTVPTGEVATVLKGLSPFAKEVCESTTTK